MVSPAKVNINSELEQELKNIFGLKFANTDGIILEDYNKGTLLIRNNEAFLKNRCRRNFYHIVEISGWAYRQQNS